MRLLKIRDLHSYQEVKINEAMAFEGGTRRVLEGTSNKDCEIWVQYPDGEERLAGIAPAGQWKIDVIFPEGGDSHVQIACDGGSVYVKDWAYDQRIKKTEDAPFTRKVEKLARDPRMEAMIQVMRANEDARNAAFQKELAKLKEANGNAASKDAGTVSGGGEATPAPNPEPPAESEGLGGQTDNAGPADPPRDPPSAE